MKMATMSVFCRCPIDRESHVIFHAILLRCVVEPTLTAVLFSAEGNTLEFTMRRLLALKGVKLNILAEK